jgi:hypothetical protein
MDLFPLDVAMFSLLTTIGVLGALYFRRHPERSHTRLGWRFVSHRTPEPGPVRFLLGAAAAMPGWSLHVFTLAVLCFAALCVNLADELRAQRREPDSAHAAASR